MRSVVARGAQKSALLPLLWRQGHSGVTGRDGCNSLRKFGKRQTGQRQQHRDILTRALGQLETSKPNREARLRPTQGSLALHEPQRPSCLAQLGDKSSHRGRRFGSGLQWTAPSRSLTTCNHNERIRRGPKHQLPQTAVFTPRKTVVRCQPRRDGGQNQEQGQLLRVKLQKPPTRALSVRCGQKS